MSDLPVMSPSAVERLRTEAEKPWNGENTRNAVDITSALAAIEAAFRDGALAERKRIVEMLQEPSDEMVWAACPHIKQFMDDPDVHVGLPQCQRCPHAEATNYGPAVRACRLTVEMALEPAMRALADLIGEPGR